MKLKRWLIGTFLFTIFALAIPALNAQCIYVCTAEEADIITSKDWQYTIDSTTNTAIISGYIGNDKDITIPEQIDDYKVKAIADSAFKAMDSITSIIIPDSVTSIGMYAFSDCTNLKQVKLSNNITQINHFLFTGCTALTNVNIPDGVTDIRNFAFYKCINLIEIVFPSGLKTINSNAFGFCESLTSVVIPNSVTSISSSAFYNCDNITIHCSENSYAYEYLQNNNIKHQLTSIENADINLESKMIPWSFKELEPAVTVTYEGIILEENKEYTVSYKNNINVGTATVVIKGIDTFSGTATSTFEIKYAIESVKLTDTNVICTGKPITIDLIVSCVAKNLVEGTDYTVTYKNNINAGKATIVINGIGECMGNVTKTFIISPAKTNGLKQNKSYAKKYIKLSWSKVFGADGYEVYRATSKKSTYKKVKTTVKTSFKNVNLKAGKNYFYKVRAYKVIDGQKVYGEFSSVKKMVTKTNAPKVKTKKISSNKVKLTWKKVMGANGYEVYMKTGTKGKYKKIKTLSAKKLTFTKAKLISDKKYSFKVRAYRKVGNNKIYSAWSMVKNVRIK